MNHCIAFRRPRSVLRAQVLIALALAASLANADPDPARTETILSPEATSDSRFGAAVAGGDFDGDGVVDLAIGDPFEHPLSGPVRGMVRTFHRTPFGWESRHLADLNNLAARFGATLAFADFDEDGRQDLLIGAPRNDDSPGIVYLLRHTAPNVTSYGQLAGTYAARCGSSLAVGDFNDDGHMDFATGCPEESVGGDLGAGEVKIGYGEGTGAFFWGVLNQDTGGVAGSAEVGDGFGSSLASGDFNCDGISDLAVGVPREGTNGALRAGVVQVFHGATNGMPGGGNQLWDQEATGTESVSGEGDLFGHALAAGGFDNNVFEDCDDLAVGIPYDAGSSAGTVVVIEGSPGGLTPLGARRITRFDFVGVANAPGVQRLGLSLLAAELGRGAQDDLVLGLPGEPALLPLPPNPPVDSPGVVCIAYGGSGSGVFAQGAQCISATDISESVAADLDFGLVLAAVAPPGESAADLAIGLPASEQVLLLRNTLFRDGFDGELD